MPCKTGCKEGQKEDSPGVCPGAQCEPKKEDTVKTFRPCPNLSKCPKRKSMEEIKPESHNNELLNKSLSLNPSVTKVLK